MKQKAIIVLFTCLCANISFAQSSIIKDNSNPGLWEITLKTKENDKILIDKKIQKCLTKDYLAKNSEFNLDDIWDKNKLSCKRTLLKTEKNETNAGFVCTPVSSKTELVKIEINSFHMSEKDTNYLITEYKTKDKSGSQKLLNTSIRGKRLGNC